METTVESLTTRNTWIRRVRVGQAFVSLVPIAGASLLAGHNPLAQWWFWVAATTCFTIAILEPYYTSVPAALAFSVGGFAAGLTAEHQGVSSLWYAYFILTGSVFVAAVIAMTSSRGRLHDSSKWVSTRFGRPLWIGLSAIAIELLRQSVSEPPEQISTIGLGTLLAFVVAMPDWYRLFIAAKPELGGLSTIETALDPNVLLISTTLRLLPGDYVQVEGQGSSTAVVVRNLAHKNGNRVQLALDRPWYEVVSESGEDCAVVPLAAASPKAIALVSEGSTDRALSLRPLEPLARGQAVYAEHADTKAKYLYQIVDLELTREVWDQSAMVTERASAVILGALTENGVETASHLPAPYVPVFPATNLTASLPEGFHRIGTIAGTDLPVGVSAIRLRGHHLAILGMSGMGKSTIARKIMNLLRQDSTVIAMDGTGEYRSRFNMEQWNSDVGLDGNGAWVYEPAGVQSAKAAEFIEQVMTRAAEEYKDGPPHARTVLLEEAHSYLPEWNFVAARNESDNVAKSCRMILQSRKFGVNFVFVSQRTAVISKSALSQCESYVVLRTLDETSLQYIEGVLGGGYRDVVAGLSRFQAVCIGPAFSTASPVVVNLDGPD